jgi:hypothetical protein
MADIKLGQSIAGSLTSSDPKIADPTSLLNGSSYDEYTVSGLDTFRQVSIALDKPTSPVLYPGAFTGLQVVNADTGAPLAQSVDHSTDLNLSNSSNPQILGTTFPGINYKIQVIGANADYKLSFTDAGKATSIVSPTNAGKIGATNVGVGTFGANGVFSPLASSLEKFNGEQLLDIALAPNGQFYGVGTKSGGSNILYRIDPGASYLKNQVSEVSTIKDPQGLAFANGFESLEFSSDNKLYSIGRDSNKLYQIDVTTGVATTIASLPTGFVSSGDLAYDATNNRFLATSGDTFSSDALWSIPLANPSGATKVGQIGFTRVAGLDFENGQLTGFTNSLPTSNRIKINSTSGAGTLDIVTAGNFDGIGLGGINGATSLPGQNSTPVITNPTTPIIPTTPVVTPTTPTTPVGVNPNTPVIPITTITTTPTTPVVPAFPTSAVDAIGTKGQSLTSRTLDLTNYGGQTLKVDTVTKGDAAYTNNVGFYSVQDAIGTIKLADGSTLKPGDANYAVEAIRSAILQAGKIDSKLGRDIAGGEIYAPVVVAQGSFNDFVSKNPTNGGGGNKIHAYFNYLGANTDNFDHFKLTAPNTFAVEDMYGGGDKDFNDLIVNMNVKTA